MAVAARLSPMASLPALIDAELRRPAPAPVVALAAQLAARAGGRAAAVLFYGSALRDEALDGVLDFYVLLDVADAWPEAWLATAANRLLPPNVGYFEGLVGEGLAGESPVGEGPAGARRLRAKYAVMTRAQFAQRMSPQTLDTTRWARFSQPCVCVWSRSEADQAAAAAAVGAAVVTAARWAAELGPSVAEPAAFWRALFARTYVAELRVERNSRSADIVERDAARYAALLPLAWQAAGLGYVDTGDGRLAPQLSAVDRADAERRWGWRRRFGKPLNILRLLKSACIFEGAADYVAWKVERHSGHRLALKPWQRRHPLLAAPGIYRQLRRAGVIR